MASESVCFVSRAEHSSPVSPAHAWISQCTDVRKYKVVGPRLPDGGINWQCPCMGGGSLVAHRCGFHFRNLYVCMKENDDDDVTAKCPEQFVSWASCMQNMNGSDCEAAFTEHALCTAVHATTTTTTTTTAK